MSTPTSTPADTSFNPPKLQRMLVAMDPFDSSEVFEGYVYRIATWSHAEIVLLLVSEIADETLAMFRKQLLPPGQIDAEIQAREKELEPRLMDLAMRLRETGVRVFPRLAYGRRIGETILETAESEQVQLIVMGSRGHGAIKSLLVGSVTDYVLHRSTIPLLIIPERPAPAPGETADTEPLS